MAVTERYDIEIASASKGTSGSVGRNVIAVVGIDHYHRWPGLANAVRDATGASELFRRLGFEEITAPLLDDHATGKAIESLVTDDLMVLGPDDSLVLFYAGHGGTRKHRLGDEVIKAGYLIPVDASESPSKVSTWVDLEGWLRAVSLLPAKHILVVLDACHSGIALDPIIKWRDIGSWQDAPLSTLKARRSRRIITSALDDQVVRDSGPVYGHSLFTGCLIEGLTHGIGRGGSRVTTGSELGLYVQRRVQTYPNSRQTPDFGTFAFDDRGEMVIPLAIEPVVERAEQPATTERLPVWLDLIDLDDRPEPASEAESRPDTATSGTEVEADHKPITITEPIPTPPAGSADRPEHAFDAGSRPDDADVGAEADDVEAGPEPGSAEPVQMHISGLHPTASPAPSPPPQTPVSPPSNVASIARRPELAASVSSEPVPTQTPVLLPTVSPAPSPPPQTPGLRPSNVASIAWRPELAEPVSAELAPPPPPPRRSRRSTPILPPLPPPPTTTEIAEPTVPPPDARRWIMIGAVGALLAVGLIGYLIFGHQSSRVEPPLDAPSHVAASNLPDASPVDAAPTVAVDSPPDAKSQLAAPPAGDCPPGMVPVPAGKFWMGSPDGVGDTDEHPQHEVTLPAYCIDRTEVAVKAYAACVAAKGCSAAPLTVSWSGYSADDVKRYSRFCNRADRPDHPINCVDWNQATAYCTWAGKRLPSEAEWEYAARGNDGRLYPWGNEPPSAKRLNACGTECAAMAERELNKAWAKMYDASDGWETTAPVGSFPDGASPFRALDMAGNVWEWTADWYGNYSAAAATNPRGAKTGTAHVHRGGGWNDNDAGHVRAAFRDGSDASYRNYTLGFRCARGD